jgi:hypothetical protein
MKSSLPVLWGFSLFGAVLAWYALFSLYNIYYFISITRYSLLNHRQTIQSKETTNTRLVAINYICMAVVSNDGDTDFVVDHYDLSCTMKRKRVE